MLLLSSQRWCLGLSNGVWRHSHGSEAFLFPYRWCDYTSRLFEAAGWCTHGINLQRFVLGRIWKSFVWITYWYLSRYPWKKWDRLFSVRAVVLLEVRDNEENDIVQGATCVPSAKSVTTFTWNVKLYRVKEQFVGKYGPQIEVQNETYCAKVFKVFFYKWLGGNNSVWSERLCRTVILSQKFHSISCQNLGLETCHYKWSEWCDSTFYANGHNSGTYTAMLFSENSILAASIWGCVISVNWFE